MGLTVIKTETIDIPLHACRVCGEEPNTNHAKVGFYPIHSCSISCKECGVSVSSDSREPGYGDVTELSHYQEAAERWNVLMRENE